MTDILLLIACSFAFVALGYWCGRRDSKPVGVIRVDRSDPYEAPYLFLELEKDVSSIMNEHFVTLEVQVKNYITQE